MNDQFAALIIAALTLRLCWLQLRLATVLLVVVAAITSMLATYSGMYASQIPPPPLNCFLYDVDSALV